MVVTISIPKAVSQGMAAPTTLNVGDVLEVVGGPVVEIKLNGVLLAAQMHGSWYGPDGSTRLPPGPIRIEVK